MNIIKVNLEEELSKQRKGIVESPQLKEAQLLLEGATLEERNVLREAGLDTNLKEIETEVGVNLERGKYEERMGTKFYTETEIKAIAVKYKLRFLHSKRYKGVIAPELGAKIVRFFKEKKIDGRSHEANSNLFILAPESAFNLDEKRKPEPIDPILFFRISTSEGFMYTLIHKWGNDFSIRRRLLGIIYQSELSLFTSAVVIRTMLVNLIIAGIGFNPLHWHSLLISVGVGFASYFAYWIYFMGSDKNYLQTKYKHKITTNNWNSHERYTDL